MALLETPLEWPPPHAHVEENRRVTHVVTVNQHPALAFVQRATSPYVTLATMGVAVALLARLHERSASWGDGDARAMPRITDSLDVAAVAGVAACLLWCFAAAALPSALALYGGAAEREACGGAEGVDSDEECDPPSCSRKESDAE